MNVVIRGMYYMYFLLGNTCFDICNLLEKNEQKVIGTISSKYGGNEPFKIVTDVLRAIDDMRNQLGIYGAPNISDDEITAIDLHNKNKKKHTSTKCKGIRRI